MRFRLATSGAGGGGQDLAGGVGNLFRSISMAPAMAAQAAEEARNVQSQMNVRNAQTALYQAKAGEVEDQRERGTLGSMMQTAMMQRGVPLHQQEEFGGFMRTGQLPAKYATPADDMGPVMQAPKMYQDDTAARILQTLGLTNTAMTVGDSNSLNIAKAVGEYQDQDVMAEAVGAARRGDDMGMSRLNTVRGKKEFTPFAAVGTTGTALNQVTGEQDVANAGLRALFGNKTAAEIEADKARAGASRASAASSYASAAKTRQDMDQGLRTGDLQVVTGQDGAITVVNKRTLSAQPVLDAQGRPVIKGAAGGGGKALTEGQAKANIFGGRMLESNKILTELEREGVQRPGSIKAIAEGTGRVLGLGTDSMGGTLSDIAGSATNWTQSPKQQKVDQARRDFINAVLRRESGATIQPMEFTNAEKQYFPQPGDDDLVIAQKRQNRELATRLMLQEVPETQRYRPRPGAHTQPAERPGGATGGWDATGGAPGGGWSIQRVE
ncbi:hypothetical protein [Hydrogenophaga sp. 2FB]|uniref:hypothetical protein n=1 Tax=Hydrogenophaga sp. 2FB TaxID=2502187 RepID=UPI0010F9C78B|nr:hypothetical protein [Hydrogenophaga sp. 2FB]